MHLHPMPVDAEGCRTFGGVKCCDSATVAGTEVMQRAACAQTEEDLVDRSRDLWQAALDSIQSVAILAMDYTQQVQGRKRVKLICKGVRLVAHDGGG
jgi:hypothetical protein